ncbi:MAG TPA: hypothetical protein QF409_11700 [Acidimicrobiales bacterium]|nr:hypothetical protein [Acidimicrobiales bacterium]
MTEPGAVRTAVEETRSARADLSEKIETPIENPLEVMVDATPVPDLLVAVPIHLRGTADPGSRNLKGTSEATLVVQSGVVLHVGARTTPASTPAPRDPRPRSCRPRRERITIGGNELAISRLNRILGAGHPRCHSLSWMLHTRDTYRSAIESDS